VVSLQFLCLISNNYERILRNYCGKDLLKCRVELSSIFYCTLYKCQHGIPHNLLVYGNLYSFNRKCMYFSNFLALRTSEIGNFELFITSPVLWTYCIFASCINLSNPNLVRVCSEPYRLVGFRIIGYKNIAFC
jgi:hypothetical protein